MYWLSYLGGEGDGTPLQYSCLENPMDGGAWWAAVHGVAKSRTRLRDFTSTFHFHALGPRPKGKGLDIWVANNRTCTENRSKNQMGKKNLPIMWLLLTSFHHYLITLYKGKKDTGRMVREGCVKSSKFKLKLES